MDYSVHHISSNAPSVESGRKGKRRPQSASVTGSAGGRRNSMLAATIQEEFLGKRTNSHSSGVGTRQDFGVDTHANGNKTLPSGNIASKSVNTSSERLAPPICTIDTAQPTMTSAMRSRPATAPKRRPPVLVNVEDELPPWRSRGKVDMVDSLLRQDNKISMYRRKEWPKQPMPPRPTQQVLGPDNSEQRKTIKSSHSRKRHPKTSGPIVNLVPYKMPPHHFPPQIVREDTPAESPTLRDRRWSFSTAYLDVDERAKPERRTDVMSPSHFHETFRLPPQRNTDYVEVTTNLDTITASYPRGRF